MTRRVDDRPTAPSTADSSAADTGERSPHGAHSGAVLSRSERAERRRRARRTTAKRVWVLAGALVVVLVTAALAVSQLTGLGTAPADPAPAAASPRASETPSAPRTTTTTSAPAAQPDPADERAEGPGDTGDTGGADAGSTAAGDAAVEGPEGGGGATSAPRTTPGTARGATPSAAPTTPVALTATQPQARATQLLTAFERLASRAAPGALVATAQLGEQVAAVPTGLVGEWGTGRAANGWTLAANGDAALRAGKVVAASSLPTTGGTGSVVVGGSARTLPTVSAAQALTQVQLARYGACARCAALVVTSARASSTTLATTSGVVRVPAWEFSLAGTKARLVRPALSPAGLIQVAPTYRPAVPAAVAATLLPLWKVAVSADQRVVTAVVERREIAARPGCWRLYAVEGRSGVALYAAKGKADATAACATPSGRVSVRLASPLRARTLLDAYWQRALPARD